MTNLLRIVPLLIILIFFSLVNLTAAEILTNDSVITMVKANLGEKLIIAKIKASQSNFDLSTDKILMLKKQRVSENIINSMLEASAPSISSDPKLVTGGAPIMTFLGLASLNKSCLYIKTGSKVCELPPIIAEVTYSMKKHWIPFYFGSGDMWHYIRGEKSVIRLNEKNPIFYTEMNPSSFLLVRLSYHQGKNIRYVISTGSTYRDNVPLKYNRKADDFFELLPVGGLEPGEYAFINSMTFYDFGID